MKALIMLLFLFGSLSVPAQYPDQPECVGLTTTSPPAYATLIDGRHGISCSHWHPGLNATVQFGNGSTGMVKSVCKVRGGYYDGRQYDLAVIEFWAPVDAEPAQTWWTRPFTMPDTGIGDLTGYGPGVPFSGHSGYVLEGYPDPYEIYNGVWFMSEQPGQIVPGYSGSPVFYKGKLIGVNWGQWKDSSGVPQGGVVTPIWMVFAPYWQNFPSCYHPPEQPLVLVDTCRKFVTLIQRPDVGMMLESSGNLEDWQPIQNQDGFAGYEDCPGPGASVVRWKFETTTAAFFRGSDEAAQQMKVQPMRAPLVLPDEALVSPCK